MKATGIVRRIDDLGRIVIPKEIRKTLKIHEGSPLEIFTDSEGNVIFKKYSPVGEMSNLAEIYAQVLSNSLSCGCVITDTDKVLTVCGMPKKECINKNISEKLRLFCSQRKLNVSTEAMPLTDTCDKTASLTCLISSEGDPVGLIILTDVSEREIADKEKILKLVAHLIGKQTE